MPNSEASEFTAIRQANDLDEIDDEAWSTIEQRKWIPTPQLLFAFKQYLKEKNDNGEEKGLQAKAKVKNQSEKSK